MATDAKLEVPKTVPAVCKNCSNPMMVEVPEYMKRVEPCKCGITEDVRVANIIATRLALVLVTLFLAMLGSCWSEEYYRAERVKAVKALGYELYDYSDPRLRATPVVDPKKPDPTAPGKTEEKKKP